MPQDIAGCIVKRKKIIPIAMPTPPTEQTASNVFQEVYNTPEIRQRIVSYLPERSLNRIGTLEKRFYADVARELFHEVTFREVCKMRRDTEWRAINCDAVRSVWFDAAPLTASLLRQSPELEKIYRPESAARRGPAHIERNDDRAIDLIIASILKVCPLVNHIAYKTDEAKKIKGDSRESGDDWVVRLDRAGTKTITLNSYVMPRNGKPESAFKLYDCSKGSIEGIDVTLDLSKLRGSLDVAWREFFRQGPPPKFDIWQLRLGQVSSSVPELAIFFDRNRLGGPYRQPSLEVLEAMALKPYTVDDLIGFGRSAGSRLAYLGLHVSGGCQNSRLGAADIARLERIIKDHFPRLHTLSFDLDYDAASEIACLAQLQPAMASRGGQLGKLYVRVREGANAARLYNLMRRLNPLLRPAGELYIVEGLVRIDCGFLQRYISSLSRSRREVIATLDFASIDLSQASQLESIQWLDEIPQPLWSSAAAFWVDRVKAHRVDIEPRAAEYRALLEEIQEAASKLAQSQHRTMTERRALLRRVADLESRIKVARWPSVFCSLRGHNPEYNHIEEPSTLLERDAGIM